MMRIVPNALLLFCLACRVLADDKESDESKLIAAMRQHRVDLEKRIDEQIAANLRGAKKGVRPQNAARDNQKLAAKKRILQQSELSVPPMYLWLGKKGDVGLLSGNGKGFKEDDNKFRVLQVIDGRNMIITTTRGRLEDVFVAETGEELISKQVTVWISGLPTEGITDDSFVRFPQLFEVKGTKRYHTTTGSNTVLEISPFSIQDLETLKKWQKGEKK